MSETAGYLLLEDGTAFHGRSVAAAGAAFGEAVFTTAMTGYQETVTDPSYAEQLICFTAPMVGNYGVADTRLESSTVQARAVLMRESAGEDWLAWLREHGLVPRGATDPEVLRVRSVAIELPRSVPWLEGALPYHKARGGFGYVVPV